MNYFLLIFIILFKFSYSYININPVVFDKDISGQGESVEYTLFNGTEKNLRYGIYIEPPSKGEDMSIWTEFFPKTLNIKPGAEARFKVFIQAPSKTEKGEYFALLGLREQGVLSEEEIAKRDSSVQLLTNLRVQLSGYVGDISSKLQIENLKVEKKENSLLFTGTMENIGERRGVYQIYLGDSKGKNSFYLGEKRVLKNEKIELSIFSQEIKNSSVIKNIQSYNTLFFEEKNGGEKIKISL